MMINKKEIDSYFIKKQVFNEKEFYFMDMLWLKDNQKLPNNLEVNELFLGRSYLEKLPKNLKINKTLFLNDKIKTLPECCDIKSVKSMYISQYSNFKCKSFDYFGGKYDIETLFVFKHNNYVYCVVEGILMIYQDAYLYISENYSKRHLNIFENLVEQLNEKSIFKKIINYIKNF
jgi:hypothetical protein